MSRPPKPLIERKMPIPRVESSRERLAKCDAARRCSSPAALGDRPRDGRTARARRLDACTRVPAGSRRSTGLEAAGCRLLQLDVTDEGSMRAAVGAIERAEGAVGVLVNNAGYSLSGAVESVALDEARRQFETNVFGLARLTQLVLPGMRREGWGGSSTSARWAGGSRSRAAAGTTPRSTPSRRSRRASLRGQGFGIDVVVI